MSTLPSKVAALIEHFARNRDAYHSPGYNEAQTRREFIDPFFKALGWDVDNESGLAEAYKDVIHEDAIKVGGASKAPDYCFRIGGTRKFFIEAKKPAIGLETDPEPAYQLRRYAWTSKLPLSILTDFEELAVYDCRIPPKVGDKASVARVFFGTCDEYAAHWDYIAGLFSKDAVLKGAFDKYAESNKRKKGTAEVDTEFLKQIEAWRLALAQNFALRNPSLSARDLNFAVQRTIDRLVFLRMCEDRGIEICGGLQSLLNGENVYERLAVRFRQADDKYNSGLFYFTAEAGREPPDTFTLALQLDDKVLKDIIKSLYYPESPYEFSVLPPEILGQVYEQFLGKVIRLIPFRKGSVGVPARHRAVVEEKPEVRKAGGVYYTPAYIVDYIVKNTVGKLLEGKTPPEIGPTVAADPRVGRSGRRPVGHGVASAPRGRRRSRMTVPSTNPSAKSADHPLRILDPACGSGSFLLGAYQFLLNWHRDWYVAQMPGSGPQISQISADGNPESQVSNLRQSAKSADESSSPASLRRGAGPPWRVASSLPLYQAPGNQWLLTIQEKKRILLNHIYGVDIDPQAVETTKLSLLLKVLEGESEQTIGSTLRLFHERALPDLDQNIKCGNSLIGPDFYENQQMTMFDEDERLRINAFDWKAEFPAVFAPRAPRPSRDRQGAVESRPAQSGSAQPSPTPGSLAPARGSDPDPGFDAVIGNPPYGAAVEPTEVQYLRARYDSPSKSLDSFLLFVEKAATLLRQRGIFGMIIPSGWVSTPSSRRLRSLFVQKFRPLSFVSLPFDVFSGAYIDAVIVTAARTEELAPQSDDSVKLIVFPHRHRILSADEFEDRRFEGHYRDWLARPDIEFLITAPSGAATLLNRIGAHPSKLGQFMNVKRGIETYAPTPDRRGTPCATLAFTGTLQRYDLRQGETAYIAYTPDIAESKPHQYFSGDRILLRQVLSRKLRLQAVLVTDTFLTNQSVQSLIPNSEAPLSLPLGCILALLNSKLMSWYFVEFNSAARRDDFPKIIIKQTRELPLPSLDLANTEHKTAATKLEKLARQMSQLHSRIGQTKTPAAQTALQRQIDATDRQIDQLVYQLYGLTDEEIKIVEEATR